MVGGASLRWRTKEDGARVPPAVPGRPAGPPPPGPDASIRPLARPGAARTHGRLSDALQLAGAAALLLTLASGSPAGVLALFLSGVALLGLAFWYEQRPPGGPRPHVRWRAPEHPLRGDDVRW